MVEVIVEMVSDPISGEGDGGGGNGNRDGGSVGCGN